MASRRCSPTVLRSASSAALTFALLASCGGGGVGTRGTVSPTPSSRAIAFTEVVSTAQARHDSGPTLVIGTSDASRATIARVIPNAGVAWGRVLVAALQGEQRTGGYSIHITRIERTGDRLDVHATFTEPAKDAMVTQVLTSPAHVVSIASADASGVREAVLLDESGAERARTNVS